MEQRSARTTPHEPQVRRERKTGNSGTTTPEEERLYRAPAVPHPAEPVAVPDPPAAGVRTSRKEERQRDRRPSAPPKDAETPSGEARRSRPEDRRAPTSRALLLRVLPRPLADRAARLPRARLTGLGCGLLATTAMLLVGAADAALLDGEPVVYCVLFLLAVLASACWVRAADLIAAPIAAPLAFTAGLLTLGGPGEGFSGLAQDVFTHLALNAGWVYAGTGLAGAVVLLRRISIVAGRRR
ncbi:DUF6542 domain-containing protein [Streptomyces sulphureus]|uniref:DUF6542 domain-containing protein n=1 Tax=Streptomyces sulphureus TaxID=47758 RepID=UPI000360F360|nr:DUF6542 domain-containing protein [Streptomyces sulphureus]